MTENFYAPRELAARFIDIGEKKAGTPVVKQFVSAVMAGVFIALAGQGANAAAYSIAVPGVAKLAAGALFTCGLMLVSVAGGELFTGNCLMVIALTKRRIAPPALLRSWGVVYIGNFTGALIITALIKYSGQLNLSDGLLAAFTIKTAAGKVNMSFINAFCMGALCNILVCAAVLMAASAKDISGKIWACFFPILLFVTSGFEHSVANMYGIPAGIWAKANPEWAARALETGLTRAALDALNVKSFLLNNLLPVTLGNIVGGVVFVGLAYVYLYSQPE